MTAAALAHQYTAGQLVTILTDAIRRGQSKDEIRTIWMAYAMRFGGRPVPLFNFLQREGINGRAK